MTAAIRATLTAEEFARLPQPDVESLQELVEGCVVDHPLPTARHGICCAEVCRVLVNFVRISSLEMVPCSNVGVITRRDPDSVRCADFVLWNRRRMPQVADTYIEIAPDLIVEVVSPSDIFSSIQRKVREYLDRGVRLVWVVDPENRELSIYRPQQRPLILTEGETVTGEDVLPGFTCRVAELLP